MHTTTYDGTKNEQHRHASSADKSYSILLIAEVFLLLSACFFRGSRGGCWRLDHFGTYIGSMYMYMYGSMPAMPHQWLVILWIVTETETV